MSSTSCFGPLFTWKKGPRFGSQWHHSLRFEALEAAAFASPYREEAVLIAKDLAGASGKQTLNPSGGHGSRTVGSRFLFSTFGRALG